MTHSALVRENKLRKPALICKVGFLVFLVCLVATSGFVQAAEPTSGEAEPPFFGLVTGDRVLLRALPSRTAEILGRRMKQDKILVFEKKGKWYGVPVPATVDLYIAADFVRKVYPGGWEVTGDRVNVRSGPGTHHAILGQVERGDGLVMRSVDEAWVAIQPPKQCRVWIHSDYVVALPDLVATDDEDV